MIILRISEYKSLGLKEIKQKVEVISSLLGKLHLHESSPQAARSVARAIPHIFFLCHLDNSFTRTLHLLGYPQGQDRFTSPSICKLYGGCKRYKDNANDRLCFPNASNIYISHPNQLSTRAALAFRTPGLLSSSTTISTLSRYGNSISPHLRCYPRKKK